MKTHLLLEKKIKRFYLNGNVEYSTLTLCQMSGSLLTTFRSKDVTCKPCQIKFDKLFSVQMEKHNNSPKVIQQKENYEALKKWNSQK